ncbi:MAG: SDR family oxidoreductase [Terriglobus roseus]|nr:SDR family oxidoreductase [Terriglobus roseus]
MGAGICRNLASKGCSLVMNYTSDSSQERTEALSQELQSEYGIQTAIVQADMGSVNGPSHVVATAKNHFSHPKTGSFTLHIIINNAGVSVNRPLGKCDADDFAYQYNVNVRGPLLLVQAALPYLPTDRSGRIVNLSSVSSSMGFPGQTVYGGTKAALDSMTRTWARELAEHCTVNAVNPGPVEGDMYAATSDEFKRGLQPYISTAPLMAVRKGVDDDQLIKDAEISGGRPAYFHEIAGVVGMLCTPDSAWCTGSVICANGGFRFSP